jgi:hypothetical protein
MMIDYVFMGGPLDGQTIKARKDSALTRSAAGLALPVSVGDRGVMRLNRGKEPGPVYIRRLGTYVWLPDLAAQRQAERRGA